MKLGERFAVDGHECEWNGFTLVFDITNIVPFDHEPTEEETRLIILGWQWGYEHGKDVGRSILQNDFKNLMGLNR